MKRLLFSSLVILSVGIAGAQERIYYISPGIQLSSDPKRGLSLSVKISFGVLQDETFHNITMGTQRPLHRGSGADFENNFFLESEVGTLVNNAPLFVGGGLGAIIYRDSGGLNIRPRLSAFAGFLAFGNLEFTYINEEESMFKGGISAELPLPLTPLDLNLD